MELYEKIQLLRKQRGITQQALADALFVSRTAVSKWEAGRGYPNIDSLKAIAEYFSVSLDFLLSADELLLLAKEDRRKEKMHFRDLLLGGLDLFSLLLLFLPVFAMRAEDGVFACSLLSLSSASPYYFIVCIFFVISETLLGTALLALQNWTAGWWIKSKSKLSFAFNLILVAWFILGLHPYAAILSLSILAIKTLAFIKRQ